MLVPSRNFCMAEETWNNSKRILWLLYHKHLSNDSTVASIWMIFYPVFLGSYTHQAFFSMLNFVCLFACSNCYWKPFSEFFQDQILTKVVRRVLPFYFLFMTILPNAKQEFSERARIHSLGRSVTPSFLPWVVNFCLYFRWPMHNFTWRREKCCRMVRQMWNIVKQWVMG